jgi:hypothetical protein
MVGEAILMENTVQLSCRIPRSVWKAARLDAIERGIPFHQWLTQAIEMRLRRNDGDTRRDMDPGSD